MVTSLPSRSSFQSCFRAGNPAADDHSPGTFRLPVAQQIVTGIENLLTVSARHLKPTGFTAIGQDNSIKTRHLPMYQIRIFLYKGDIRICQNMFFIIPDQRRMLALLSGRLASTIAAAEAPLFKQSYLMSPLGSGQRSLTSGRACSHNRYTLLFSCLCNRFTLIFVKNGIYGTVNGSMPSIPLSIQPIMQLIQGLISPPFHTVLFWPRRDPPAGNAQG